MKKNLVLLSLILFWVGLVNAYEVLDSAYTIENYAEYVSSSSLSRMVFDDSGNLYINHTYGGGKVMKIDGQRQSSVLATGLDKNYDITWGGGTVFGDYLYLTRIEGSSSDRIWQIDTAGNVSNLTYMPAGGHAPGGLAIDRTGNYGGKMYVGTTGQDKLYSVTSSGSASLFSSWPGWTDGGGVFGLEFDTTGNFGGKMFACTSFGSSNANISGLFAVESNGSVSRFNDALVSTGQIGFDEAGTYFDKDMFVIGRTSFDAINSLWRISPDGSYEEFMRGVRSFTFDQDGALYVSSFNWSTNTADISRVTPEPATLLMFIPGILYLRGKRKMKA